MAPLKQLLKSSPSKKSAQKVTFEYSAPSAKEVYLAGSFNNWDIWACPLNKDRNGNWKTTLTLAPGRYEYLYVVDRVWQCNPQSSECAPNPFGSWNSVIKVE